MSEKTKYRASLHSPQDGIYMDRPLLKRYHDGRTLRNATAEEQLASIAAAESDGGAGVIDVDGVSCYVED